MITRIEGVLESIEGGAALVRPAEGGLTYQVLLTAHSAGRLGGSIGQSVVLFTLYFIESQAQGATMTPRLAGFLTDQERRFFELFTTCKGIGNRKALRAMAMDVGQLAAAISDRDAATLQSLPEIGRRTAETIVATLRGKVDPFITHGSASDPLQAAGRGDAESPGTALAREALEVLLQLGENRNQAADWIDRALRDSDQPPGGVQELIARVYQFRSTG